MFDSRGDADGDAEPMLLDDPFAPPRTDEEIAALIAGDPGEDPDPTLTELPDTRIADVIAAGQTAPVTDFLISQLSRIDVDSLDDDQRVGYSVAWNRVVNHATAQRGRAVAAVARHAQPVLGSHPLAEAAGEIGAALALGRGAADDLVDSSLLLADRLAATVAAGLRGDVSWDKASTLAQQTAGLTPDKARQVEDRVLPFAAGRTPARHRDAVRRAVDRIDPDGADERRKQAKQDIRMIRTHYGDGMADLLLHLPAEQADTVWTAATAHARAAKAAGDPRTLDQLRVAALFGWAESFLTHGDWTYCDRNCQPPLPTDTDNPEPDCDEPDEDNGPNDDGDDDGPGPGPGPGPNDSGPGPAGDEPCGWGPTDGAAGPDDDRPGGDAPSDGAELEPIAPAAPTASTAPSGPPTRHGRPVRVATLWDLESLLGLTRRPGELLDSGATLPPQAMGELVARGVRLRRMLIHPDHGELLDLTPVSWRLPGTTGPPGHAPPVQLNVLLTEPIHRALTTGDTSHLAPHQATRVEAIRAALNQAHPVLQQMVDYPVTADQLDNNPHAETPSPALAEFVALRDRHPTNPTAGPSAASAGDLDHPIARAKGGLTIRANLTGLTRRWHVLKTHGRWIQTRHGRGWQWTSPTGRAYTTTPYDYRYDI